MRKVIPLSPPTDPVVTDTASLGAAIRSARTQAGITLTDAAAALGMSRQTLINIETGQGNVALPLVLHAAGELGVTLLAVPSGQREPARRALQQLASQAGDHGA